MTDRILQHDPLITIVEYQTRWPDATPCAWIGALEDRDAHSMARAMRKAVKRGHPLTKAEANLWQTGCKLMPDYVARLPEDPF